MIDIQPTDEFKNEVASMPQPEVIKPSLDITPPVIPVLSPEAQEANNVELHKDKQKARRWRIESISINLFTFIILGVSLVTILPVVLAGATNTSIGFFTLILAGIPGLFGFLLLKRSDMARRVIITFMILNIAVNFFPGAFNIFSIASSLGVALFLIFRSYSKTLLISGGIKNFCKPLNNKSLKFVHGGCQAYAQYN